MPTTTDKPTLLPGGSPDFCTTHWSVVLLAGGTSSSDASRALEELCHAYWFPIYAHVRRRGHRPEDAQDLTQEFFTQLVGRRDLAHVDRNKGKFRAFLLACLNHFLAKDWRSRNTLKRGGGQNFIPLDSAMAEERLVASGSSSDATAERLYDQCWAMTVMEQSLETLRQEWIRLGKGAVFEELKVFLSKPAADGAYVSVAPRLNLTPSTVATMVHRLRHRYRELVRATLSRTVTTPLELEEEMRYLLEVLS